MYGGKKNKKYFLLKPELVVYVLYNTTRVVGQL